MDDIRPPLAVEPTRFIDQLRSSIRRRGLSYATEKTYVYWVLRFIRFHNRRHPERMGPPEVEEFLGDLAEQRRCAVATQRLALNALVFLYDKHLHVSLGKLHFHYAQRQRRMPTVFTHAEATTIIRCLSGVYRTMGALMYGSGLRVNEVLRLRVKDLDFGSKQVTVRDGKGGNVRLSAQHKQADYAVEQAATRFGTPSPPGLLRQAMTSNLFSPCLATGTFARLRSICMSSGIEPARS